MSINFKLNANKLSKKITEIINEDNINIIAKDNGFFIREVKLDGFKFLDMLLFTHFNHKELSLNDLSIQLKIRYGITIRKQSIDERFTETAVKFLKTVLEKIINIYVQKNNEIDFTKYANVRIKDSTAFQLPPTMEDKYPGSGGSASTAMIRIQFEYDLKTGKILDLSIYPFNNQDTKNAKETIDNIQENDLVIRDLAYTAIKNLQKIEEKNAFYLNRLNSTTNVYEDKKGQSEELDFNKLQNYMKANNLQRIEKDVYVGKQEKFKTHIIIELLPQERYDQRVRKAKKEAKRKGRKLGKIYKSRMGLNVFITNTDIPATRVRIMYTMRWQIELMFKIWKSTGEIHKVKKMKIERFEAVLFAKLIWIAINWQIMWQIIVFFYTKRNIKISPFKIFKTLKLRLNDFRIALYTSVKQLSNYINEIAEISPENHESEKKKNSTNWSYEIYKIFAVNHKSQIIK